MQQAYRTPSPEKVPPNRQQRRHSPWTAPRARKKGKSSPEAKLPGLEECPSEATSSAEGTAKATSSCHAGELGLHDAQNPFLEQMSGQSVPTHQAAKRSIRLQPPQGCHSTTAWSDLGSLISSTALQSLPALQRTTATSGPNANLHAFLSNTQAAANSTAEHLLATLSSQAALAKENHAPMTDRTAVGFDYNREGAQSDAAEQARKVVGSHLGADTNLARSSTHTDRYEVSGCIFQRQILGDLPACSGRNGSQDRRARSAIELAEAHTQYGFKQGTELAQSPSQVLFVSDGQRGTLSLQRTPGASAGPPSVAATPSPDVPAPGIRHDLHGRAPPRVPTSCRTIRRVLVDSPPDSANLGRRASSSSTDACACKPRPARTALRFGESADGGGAPMSVERLLHDQQHPSNFAWQHADRDRVQTMEKINSSESLHLSTAAATDYPAFELHDIIEQHMEEAAEDSEMTQASSPEFVLARGHVTPDNLLPGWDEEEDGPGGPLKGSGMHSIRLSGELSTFDQRLHEAVQNGDAVTVGQAWHDVRAGTLKPEDVDTLNTLLKCYCKIEGDPGEAEEVVKEACKGGRLQPNSATYHHMAALWTRHEQLNNSA